MILIKRTDCPAPARGIGSSAPSVSIRENGQVVFNKKLVEDYFGKDKKYLIPSIDDRTLTLKALVNVPTKMKEDDLFKLSYSEKQGGAYSAMSGLFKHEAVAYDYKASGNQTFEVSGDAKKNEISFELPHSMTRKPTVKRAKKNKTTAPATETELESID